MDQETRNQLTLTETLIYACLSVIIVLGWFLAQMDESLFRAYVDEDGFFETCTAIFLVIAALIVTRRFLRDRRQHPWTFTLTSLSMTVLFIVGTGEEISWGQRIFNIESNDFFMTHNRQGETNLHNMLIGSVNVNKLLARMSVFLILIIYLIIPYAYFRRGTLHRFIFFWRVPVPKIHHGVALLILAILISLIPSGKRGELNEFMISVFILLLVTHGQNIRRDPRQ